MKVKSPWCLPNPPPRPPGRPMEGRMEINEIRNQFDGGPVMLSIQKLPSHPSSVWIRGLFSMDLFVICSLDYNNARGCFPAQEFLFGLLHLSTCEQAQKIKTILKKPLLQFCWRQFTQVKTFYAYGHKEEVSFWPILWEMKPCPPPPDPWPN